MRKIIQIIMGPHHLYALADDGTVWGHLQTAKTWIQLPALPQPSAPPAPPSTGNPEQPDVRNQR